MFLSWDCANRTLGWSFVNIDRHIYSKLASIHADLDKFLISYLGVGYNIASFRKLLHNEEFLSDLMFFIDTLDYFLQNFIQYTSAGVVDTLDGSTVKDTDEIQRTVALKKWLESGPVSIAKIQQPTVLIEKQPPKIGKNTNSKSTMVSYQLAFYYADLPVVFVDPKHKNQIALSDMLTRDAVLERKLAKVNAPEKVTKRKGKVKTAKDIKYEVNKLHSLENFLHLVTAFDLQHVIADVPNAVRDDLADSTMQILAYLVKNNLFI